MTKSTPLTANKSDTSRLSTPLASDNSDSAQPSTPLAANRSVTFGPDLSPEQFDHGLPSSTPLKRGGTPRRSRYSALKLIKSMIQPVIEVSFFFLNNNNN